MANGEQRLAFVRVGTQRAAEEPCQSMTALLEASRTTFGGCSNDCAVNLVLVSE
jgi:hypothetical protein